MSSSGATPELALLLGWAAAEAPSGATTATQDLLNDVADWDNFYWLASSHAVIPLVDQYLGRYQLRGVPSRIRGQLHSAAQAGAVRSLQLSAQLVAILRAFEAQGIEAMPFKGPTLAALVYGNLSLRQFEDLDILVQRRDVERARIALLERGFEPVVSFNGDQRASIQLSGHHEQLFDKATGTAVELHWLLNNRALSRDALERRWWENRQSVTIGGFAARTLGPENLLLYLCMHGGKHAWARLSWLCDLVHALRAYPGADWDQIWQRARETGTTRMLAVGIGLTRVLLNEQSLTDPALRDRPRDVHAERLVTVLAARLREGQKSEHAVDVGLQWRMRERLRDRVRYTWHVVATPHPADVGSLSLPRTLHGAYYVIRPVRLLWKYLVRRARPVRST